MDTLTKLRQQKRKVDTRVTNKNKQTIINQINKNTSDFGYGKLNKNSSVAEVTRMKNQYLERITYDIVTLAVSQGKDIVAEIEARYLRKSDDYETKRLGDFAKALSKAKRESDRKLTKEEKEFLDRGNNHIKGYGNEDIISLFEKSKSKKQVQAIIDELKTQDPKEIFYNKQVELFDKVFQKVGIVREDDINKIKAKIKSMSMLDAINQTNDLLKTLEVFDYEKFAKESTDETEIANARLDDVLIKTGISKKGVNKVKRVFDKYKK